MKFAEHLLAHITPEWRKQYINYEVPFKLLVFHNCFQIVNIQCVYNNFFLIMSSRKWRRCYTQLWKSRHRQSQLDQKWLLDTFQILMKYFSNIVTKSLKKLIPFTLVSVQRNWLGSLHITILLLLITGNFYLAEKLAEATRKYATLQSELQLALEEREKSKAKRPSRKLQDLKLAFSEFYLSLVLLQNYQNLNYTGFRKILKKHDKVMLINVYFFYYIIILLI